MLRMMLMITPSAEAPPTIEVALSRPREPEEYRSALGRCLEASAHLEDLVSSLLSLARIETGALHVGAAPVSLDGLLREAWEPFRALAAERRLVVRWDESPGSVDVRTDAALLATALRNVSTTPCGTRTKGDGSRLA